MFEEQEIIQIEKDDLPDRVKAMADDGYRLVQIGCTPLKNLQIDYSFDRDGEFENLRLTIPREGAELPSITDVYLCAFTYENELHDLFGINVTGIAIDYAGNFYRTASRPPLPPPIIEKDIQKPATVIDDKE